MRSLVRGRIILAAIIVVIVCVGSTSVVLWLSSRAAGSKRSAATRPPESSSPLGGSEASAALPSASTTGVPAGVTLTKVPGQLTMGPGWHWNGSAIVIDSDNTTLVGLDVNGPVLNGHNELSVKNSLIRCTGENDWCLTLGTHSSVIDSEIGGGPDGKSYGHAIALWSGGTNAGNVVLHVNIHHQIHGMRIDGGTTISDSYIHDLPMGDPVLNVRTGNVTTDDHTDAIMATRGGNTVVRHNRFEGGNTANLFVQRDVTDPSQRIGPLLIEGNLFVNVHKNSSDSSFGVDIENKGIEGPIVVRNNTFSVSGWTVGPMQVPPDSTVTGNVYSDGSPIS